MKVFVTGATGFIGAHLCQALQARGDKVVALSRREQAGSGIEWVAGDPTVAGPWTEKLAGCDAVVHLAGEPIADKRWSREQKRRIHASRIESSHAVVEAIGAAPSTRRPRVLVAANGVDWYPFDGSDKEYDEKQPRGQGFLNDVCADWQLECEVAEEHGARVVVMRTGLILGKGEGALARMMTPFKMFAGGPVSSGAQWFSWMHIDDAVGAYLHALDRDTVSGPVNLVAPGTVRQKAFAKQLGKALHRPSWLPVPRFALRIAVGEVTEVLVHGRRVVPSALADSGYGFRYPELSEAMPTVV
jgi:uncharacterized protein